jgi:sec-independent protein translocase protein TatA
MPVIEFGNLLAFGMPGLPELVIIAIIVLVLFGSRLPSVMRNLGSGIKEFKKGVNEGEEGYDDAEEAKVDKA